MRNAPLRKTVLYQLNATSYAYFPRRVHARTRLPWEVSITKMTMTLCISFSSKCHGIRPLIKTRINFTLLLSTVTSPDTSVFKKKHNGACDWLLKRYRLFFTKKKVFSVF